MALNPKVPPKGLSGTNPAGREAKRTAPTLEKGASFNVAAKKSSRTQEETLALRLRRKEKAGPGGAYTTYSKSEWSQIRFVTIGIATGNRIRQWAEKTLPTGKVVGEVTNANTLHHKTFKPIKGGLFCERIFGPLKDFECACSSNLGKQIKKLKKTQKKNQNLGLKSDNTAALVAQETLQKLLEKKVAMRSTNMANLFGAQRFFCPQCDVEYTWSVMRRYQLGYITLNAPVAHVWYLKSSPNYLSALLDMKRKHIEYITYCTETLTLENSLKSSAEVLTNVADTFDYINRSRAKDSSFVKEESTNGLLGYAGNGLKPKQKKNTYYFQKQYLSARSYLNVSTRKKLRKNSPVGAEQTSFTLFSNKNKALPVLGDQSQGTTLSWLTTNAINGLLQKYDKKVLAAKALPDLNFSAEMFEAIVLEEPGDLPLFYSMRQLARCGVVLTFLSSVGAQNNNLLKKEEQSLKVADFVKNKPILAKTLVGLRSPQKAKSLPESKKQGNRVAVKMFGVSKSSLRLTHTTGGQDLLHSFKLANFETFCRFKLLVKKKQDVMFNRVNLKGVYSILKEKLRQAYVMQLEASLRLQCYVKSLQIPSEGAAMSINWKQTVSPLGVYGRHFCSNSLNFGVAPQLSGAEVNKFEYLTINNLTKMVDMLWLLFSKRTQPKSFFKNKGTRIRQQQAYSPKALSPGLPKANLFVGATPGSNTERDAGNSIYVTRIMFVKKLLTPLLALKVLYYPQRMDLFQIGVGQKSLEFGKAELKGKLKNKVRNMTQESNMGAQPTKYLFWLCQKQQKNGQQSIKAAHNKQKSSLVFGRSFINKVSWSLIRFAQALISREQPYNVYDNTKTVIKPSLFAPQRSFYNKKAKALSCLIVQKRQLTPALKNAKNQKKSKKTIVNNIYCFSHRLLWNHAVDWQFFSLYYFSFKARGAVKTNQYNNTVGSAEPKQNTRSSGSRVKTMANLEDLNVPVYAYRNYDFSLLNTFFSQDLTAKSKHGGYVGDVATKFNFTQELADKQNLHINYSGAGILKTLLADLDNREIRKIYKQNVMTLFALNKRIVRTRHLLLITYQGGESKGITHSTISRKSRLSAYQKELNELCQNRELIMGKMKLLRKLFNTERPTGLAQQQETNHDNIWSMLKRPDNSVTQANPKDMVLTLLPVLPPDLRPIVKMGTQIAASDLNRFYQRILYRNDRLKRFLKDAAINGSYEMKYAQRLLQEAVDNLIQNGKSGVTPEKDARGRLLKSLSDILKGKQGRFRQYLLGKRVDYSGRSVIVVGPSLKLHECGIPKEMALELFLPFLIKRILNDNLARTVIGAKTLIKNNKPLTWSLLREILKSSPVLLNRAPTLHRLGFQAFQPKLVDGRAILLHPLVCPAFNADFDGDQMAVHVPISPEARAEAWKLMLSRNNLLSPATGEPLVLPSQDMVLGCYYLTTNGNVGFEGKIQKSEKGYGLYFHSLNDVLRAYQQGLLSIHAIIWLKWNGKVENNVRTAPNGNMVEHEPAEIRLNQYGGSHVIYARSYSTFNYSQSNNTELVTTLNGSTSHPKGASYKVKNKLVNNIIRTTPGKILFNVIVGMALNNSK